MVNKANHISLLRERVFQTEQKWPQFNLLLDDMEGILSEIEGTEATVLCFERTLLYGGYSLIAPILSSPGVNVISIDCSPESAEGRGAYNSSMVDDERFIKHKHDLRCSIEKVDFPSDSADYVLIPNLVHHVEDQQSIFSEAKRVLKTGGKLYIFEPLVRELHQVPDDYLRYTPQGLESVMKKYDFCDFQVKETGGPFEAISYCWLQALEFLPDDILQAKADWFYNEHFPMLMEWNEKYKNNLKRKNTRFPTAFSVQGVLTEG